VTPGEAEGANDTARRDEVRTAVGVAIGAVVLAGGLAVATLPPQRIAALRANAGYVLVDNRSGHGFVVRAYDGEGRPCGEVRIAAGNRGRAPACDAHSDLVVIGRGRWAHFQAARTAAYEVRWNDGWTAQPHAPY